MARGRRGSKRREGTEAGGELFDRICPAPGCSARVRARSAFCPRHETTALGEASVRELRELTRELERLGCVCKFGPAGMVCA